MSAIRTNAGKKAADIKWDKDGDATNVRNLLKKRNEPMLIKDLVKELKTKTGESNWSTKRVLVAIDRAQFKHENAGKSKGNWNIKKYQNGLKVELISNSGRNQLGKGVVGQVVSKINVGKPPTTILKAFSMHAAQRIEAIDFHGSQKNQGKWSESDALIKFYRAQGSKNPYEIHNIEVEEKSITKTKCQPQEVAQAFSAGEGADRSWLMFHEDDWKEPKSQRQRKIEWLAIELGVGLISFGESYESSTWKLILKAKKRTPSAKLRNELIKHERWG